MFNPTTVKDCLKTAVSLEGNIEKHAPTYLVEDILTDAFPKDADFDAKVLKTIEGSIEKMLYEVINKKKLTTLVKSVIADFKLFDGRADFENKNANLGRFCFLQFTPKNNEDVVLTLKRVSFQIDMAAPDLKLYLFTDDNPNEALKVLETPYTAG